MIALAADNWLASIIETQVLGNSLAQWAGLVLEVHHWFTPPDWWEFQQFSHDFNIELLRRLGEEGVKLA